MVSSKRIVLMAFFTAEITSRLVGFSVFSRDSLIAEIAFLFLFSVESFFRRVVADSYSGFNESRKAAQAALRDFLATSLACISIALSSSGVAYVFSRIQFLKCRLQSNSCSNCSLSFDL